MHTYTPSSDPISLQFSESPSLVVQKAEKMLLTKQDMRIMLRMLKYYFQFYPQRLPERFCETVHILENFLSHPYKTRFSLPHLSYDTLVSCFWWYLLNTDQCDIFQAATALTDALLSCIPKKVFFQIRKNTIPEGILSQKRYLLIFRPYYLQHKLIPKYSYIIAERKPCSLCHHFLTHNVYTNQSGNYKSKTFFHRILLNFPLDQPNDTYQGAFAWKDRQ